ncbi:MAG: pyruvate formate lyase family protein [Victivallaceae bacterium]|nr:pyruvate formate lyase family protein [Victivallaceae bacterium]
MNTHELREKTRSGFYKQFRRNDVALNDIELCSEDLPVNAAHARLLKEILEAETPVVLPGEKIIFSRTLPKKLPVLKLSRELSQKYPHTDIVENLTPDWQVLLADGLSGRIAAATRSLKDHSGDPEAEDYLSATIDALQSVAAFADRYAAAAAEPAQQQLLARVPLHPARSFHEALQSVRFISSVLRLSGGMHLGFGRFDQYMWPYLEADLAAGRLSENDAKELLAEFFISLNRDADLYNGAQLGDNGQSLMLGGCDRDGKCAINRLTYLALDVSEEVNMIDPKINLRVDANTPDDLLIQASRLTRRGLGFPQYCNDDVVIPALTGFGYPVADARDYAVAACWEFVVPDGRDTPNRFAVNFPLAADRAIRDGLRSGDSFAEILDRLPGTIREQTAAFRNMCAKPLFAFPNVLFSAFCEHAIARGRDLNRGGGSHYHYGCHGCGSSSAADALAAVRELVFEQKSVSPERLLAALETDFANDMELRAMIKAVPHKVGNNDDAADALMVQIFDEFASALAEIPDNGRGGRIRPGTGSAQFYVWLTQKGYYMQLGTTADGRRIGDYISSSLSPAPGVHARGIISELETYGKLNYRQLCNGGPITMELADAYFRNDDALEKTAKIIRAFVKTHCQQLQLNTLNPDKLRDAQLHPENYRDLIVRVWGWSGYFVELTREYQDQIIGRQAFGA